MTQILFAQSQAYLDSLKSVWKNAPNDSAKVEILNDIVLASIFKSTDSAAFYANLAFNLANKIAYKKGLARYYNNKGILNRVEGDYVQGIDNLEKALQINEEIGFKLGVANCYINIGLIYDFQGQFEIALENYKKCLKIKQEIKDLDGVANCMHDIGNTLFKQKKYTEALEYYQKSIEIRKKQGSIYEIARVQCRIAMVYHKLSEPEKALDLFQKVVAVVEGTGRTFVLSLAYNGLGNVYLEQKNYQKAIDFYQKALYFALKHHYKEEVRNAYYNLTECYLQQKKSDLALPYFRAYTLLQDSLFNLETTQKMIKMQHSLEIKKRQSEIQLLAKDKIIQQETIENQAFERNLFIAFSVLILIFVAYLFKNIHKERQTNQLLFSQKQEIQVQSKEIKEQNQELRDQQETLISTNRVLEEQKKDLFQQNRLIEEQKFVIQNAFVKLQDTSERLNQSISYAQNIQQAILPKNEQLCNFFEEYFVIYLPKDVVSGDFYWFSKIQFSPNNTNQTAILALADCTGHGVPGAFMTMIGNTLFHEAVKIKNIYEPNEILRNIDLGIKIILKQEEGKNYDGMDVGVCLFEKMENQTKISFSGAKSSLFYSENNEIMQILGDRISLGGRISAKKDFTKQNLLLPKNSLFYLASDGFADQNNPERKSYGSSNFKKLLNSVVNLPLKAQKEQILLALQNHQQSETQRDDISVMVLKI